VENMELEQWLSVAGGFEGGELPPELIPVFQSLRGKLTQSEKKILSLLHQKRIFTLLVNGTVDIFVMFSAENYKVEYVSPNLEYLLGLSIDEVTENIHRICDSATDGMEMPSAETLMAIPLGDSIHFLNEHVNLKNGERRWYRKTIYHFYLHRAHKFIMVMSDRSLETEMQRQLELSIELVKSANEAKSSFLANMSHDLRTPMNAIVGFSRLLKHDAENPAKVREYARKISSSSQHLLDLINDILDMSKIESGKASLRMDEFELGDLLESIRVVLKPQATAKGQRFTTRTSGITQDRLLGDKTRINQILMNLLSNAVKYTPEGGNIQLLISQVGHVEGRFVNLEFRVIDDGMGMSPEYLEVIFEPFTREEAAVARGMQGTGLGMAITKNLVELMGGSIAVESEKGKGSTFTVDLKFQTVETDADRDFWQEHGIRKLLVVDDEEPVCQDIAKVMSTTGVIVAHTCDPEQALQFILGADRVGQQYDIVLTDWRMPKMNGIELAGRVREALGDRMPPTILSAFDWSEIEETALQNGISGFLAKPFLISHFHAAVRQVLDPQSTETEAEEEYSLSGLHFLAAEDNELNAEILRELLDLEGASCELAENGEVAVKMLEASAPGHFDMVLMDVQMPVMDGYEAARAIRSSRHPDAERIPIAAMTANAFDEDVRHALDAGMDAHVSKPVDMNLLKKTVVELLRLREGGVRAL